MDDGDDIYMHSWTGTIIGPHNVNIHASLFFVTIGLTQHIYMVNKFVSLWYENLSMSIGNGHVNVCFCVWFGSGVIASQNFEKFNYICIVIVIHEQKGKKIKIKINNSTSVIRTTDVGLVDILHRLLGKSM